MERDQQIFKLIHEEHERQVFGIELIASENFVSDQVMEASGSDLYHNTVSFPNRLPVFVILTDAIIFGSSTNKLSYLNEV